MEPITRTTKSKIYSAIHENLTIAIKYRNKWNERKNLYTLLVFRYINPKVMMAAGAVTSVLTVSPSYTKNMKIKLLILTKTQNKPEIYRFIKKTHVYLTHAHRFLRGSTNQTLKAHAGYNGTNTHLFA